VLSDPESAEHGCSQAGDDERVHSRARDSPGLPVQCGSGREGARESGEGGGAVGQQEPGKVRKQREGDDGEGEAVNGGRDEGEG